MAPRGEVVLQITFGPSKSPLASSAASYAKEHAEQTTGVNVGVWRASFRLSTDERTYGEASQLLGMVVGGWRSTAVEVDGSPEPTWVAQQMLWCAREWLRASGACRERFFPLSTRWPKCRVCPLYDAEWAAESGVMSRPAIWSDPETGSWLEVPDHLPEDWEEG